MPKTTLCIADDHAIVCQGIASLLIGHDDYLFLESYSSGGELLNAFKQKQPDVLLLDIKMPGLSGLQVARILKKDYPKVKVIILSSNTGKEDIDEAVKAGCVGYLSKDVGEEELLIALDKIKTGGNYFGRSIQLAVFENYTEITQQNSSIEHDGLSDREVEIIRLFAGGLSYNEIAEQLFISKRTVEAHKRNILNKLELNSTVDLAKYAILNNIISL